MGALVFNELSGEMVCELQNAQGLGRRFARHIPEEKSNFRASREARAKREIQPQEIAMAWRRVSPALKSSPRGIRAAVFLKD